MIRVLIADDFPEMIEVMEKMIRRCNDMTVAGVLTNFRDALDCIQYLSPMAISVLEEGDREGPIA